MTRFQDFQLKKMFMNMAEICYEHNIDPSPLLSKAVALQESGQIEDQETYSELVQGVGQMVGQMAGAAKNVVGNQVQNFANGVRQGYGQYQNTMQPQQGQQVQPQQGVMQNIGNAMLGKGKQQVANPQRTQVIQGLSRQLQQLGQIVPQMTQQLQSIA